MKIVSTLTLRADEVSELEAIAARLRIQGFEAEVTLLPKVTKTAKPQAMLRTNAQPRTLRKARQLDPSGGITSLNQMMALVGAKMQGDLPPCETKEK